MSNTLTSGMPEMPAPAETASVQGPQGSEYRLLSKDYEPDHAMYSPDQLRAYGLACFNAGRAEGGKDAERLRHAGAMLSNCAFNLHFRNPGQFTARDIETLDQCRKAWDGAISSLPTPPAAMTKEKP